MSSSSESPSRVFGSPTRAITSGGAAIFALYVNPRWGSGSGNQASKAVSTSGKFETIVVAYRSRDPKFGRGSGGLKVSNVASRLIEFKPGNRQIFIYQNQPVLIQARIRRRKKLHMTADSWDKSNLKQGKDVA